MSYKLATIELHYRQNKHKSLDISKHIPQWMADELAIRYLELLDMQQKARKLKRHD